MARLYPFRALRYDPACVNMTDVVTQPYDKITSDMQERYYNSSPYNLIRIVLGKHLPGDDDHNNVYTRAAQTLKEWRAEGILKEESEPALYGYSQTYKNPNKNEEVLVRRGFIALGQLYDYADRVVFRHEQTFPKHKSDRLALFKATRAYCEQIYMLYSDPTFTAEKAIFESGSAPELEIVDEYDVVHRVWKLTDPALIQRVLSAMDDKWLLIADGHHRYETSTAYMHERAAELGISPQTLSSRPATTPGAPHLASEMWDKTTPNLSSRPEPSQRPGGPSFAVSSQRVGSGTTPNLSSRPEARTGAPGERSSLVGVESAAAERPAVAAASAEGASLPTPAFPEAAMMMTFVNMDAPGITILPTHRVLHGLKNFTGHSFAKAAEQYFTVEDLPKTADAAQLLAHLNAAVGVAFIAATRDDNFLLTPRADKVAPLLANLSPRQAALDVTQLHKVAIEKLLGLDEETVRAGNNIRYYREAGESIARVASGKADVAFLIKPVTLDQMKDISLNLEVMPQKSTDFYPKLLSGLAMYTLD
ncbi:MAG TPA: DUF1015 domain-containing protein [Acidobacteriaceae bacterium]